MIHHMLDSLWRRRWAGALAAAVTPPILGADGEPLPGSIAEVSTVRIGGVDQGVLVRRQSTDNPVLLYLAGGPGQLLSLFPSPLSSSLLSAPNPPLNEATTTGCTFVGVAPQPHGTIGGPGGRSARQAGRSTS